MSEKGESIMEIDKTGKFTAKKFTDINDECRIRLTPSRIGLEVLRSDTTTYGMNPNGFFNTVILNMLKYDYSVSSTVIASRERERARLKKLGLDDSTVNTLIEKYTSELITFINDKLSDKKSSSHFQFKLSKELYGGWNEDGYLMKHCFEADVYKDRLGVFLRAVFEEYAGKTHIERERIIFADIISEIEEAIASEKNYNLYLTNSAGDWRVKPYKITTDVRTSYLYLVCKSRQDSPDYSDGSSHADGKDDEWKISSFRISRIISVKKSRKDDKLTDEEKKKIDTAIYERGVAFLLSEAEEIKVRISDEGLRQYKTRLFLRPEYIEPPKKCENTEGWSEMKLRCTQRQAINYFFRFGKEVKIESPTELRDEFAKRYSEAAALYGNEAVTD